MNRKIHYNLWIALLSLVFIHPLSSQTPSVSFAKWKDNKKAAYTIIHDDYSNYVTGIYQHADPIATARGIKICFGAITSACGPSEWANARTMIAHGHECVNHSHSHKCGGTAGQCTGLTRYGANQYNVELTQSTQLIEQNTGVRPRFFVHPYDVGTSSVLIFLQNLGYLGSRLGTKETINSSNFSNFMRLNFHVFSPTTPISELNKAVDDAIAAGGYAIREFHGIDDGSWGAMTVPNYTAHMDYVKSKMDDGSIWSATATEAITFKMQKDYFQPLVNYDTATKTMTVSFAVLKAINPAVLKTPVTINVALNGILGNFDATQGDSIIPYTLNGNIITFNAYPHKGAVKFKCNNCTTQVTPLNITLFKAAPKDSAMTLFWQKPLTNFDEVMIVAKEATLIPVGKPNGAAFVADSSFTGSGTAFNGGKVVYRGNDTTMTVTNLTPGIVYYFKAYSRAGALWSDGVQISATPTGPIACKANGKLNRQTWTNLILDNGWTITPALYNDPRYPNTPTSTDTITTFSAVDRGDQYGEKIFGYITPPTTGSYTFTITGDDDTEFYLSTDDNPTNKVKICGFNGYTGTVEYAKYAGQKSAAITLDSGKYYYVEMLHLATVATNHCGAFWQTPSNATISPIGNQYFSTVKCNTPSVQNAISLESFVFDGYLEDNKAKLVWVMKSNEPKDYFIIEKADEWGGFKQLDIINADGNADVHKLQSYTYEDETLNEGDNIYRIITVGQSGIHQGYGAQSQYSKVINVKYATLNAFTVFPNPAEDFFQVDLSSAIGKQVDITLMTPMGQVVLKEKIENASAAPHRIALGSLESGQYFVRIQTQGKRVIMKKLMIMR